MAALRSPAVPVTLQIGSTTANVGTIDVPIVSSPAGRDAVGMWQVDFHVDRPELRRRIVSLLRAVADEIETGPADGD